MRIEQTHPLPPNAAEFITELVAGMGELYGNEAAAAYATRAARNLSESLSHPLVTAVVAVGAEAPVGLAMALNRDGMGHLTFVHVLKGAVESDVENDMIEHLVKGLMLEGVYQIVAEPLCFFESAPEKGFASLGFRRYERALMSAVPGDIAAPCGRAIPMTLADVDRSARILTEAYQNKPGNELHPETSTLSAAAGFLFSALSGGFGPVYPGYALQAMEGDEPVGLIVGCEEPPGIGFVLHLAVIPEYQGRGIGESILRALADVFVRRGLKRMDLGVTLTNPALRLYERLGFRELRRVPAFVWRRADTVGVYSRVETLEDNQTAFAGSSGATCMDTSSIDIYIRSLIVEALRLETRDIRVSRTESGFRIEMLVGDVYEVFPHPPVKESVDLLARLRELAKIPAPTNGEAQAGTFQITRRGQELKLGITIRNDGGTETADVKLL